MGNAHAQQTASREDPPSNEQAQPQQTTSQEDPTSNEQAQQTASLKDPRSADDNVSNLKIWTIEEIQAYNAENNANLVIVHNEVFDVTRFMDEHPGGNEVLQEVRGQDASHDFDVIGHTPMAIESMKEYLVGAVKT